MLGVVKLVPVSRTGPPVAPAYQFMVAVPELEVAPNVTVPVSQRSPGVVDVIVGDGFTVAITATRGEEVQLFSVVSTKYVVVVPILGVTKLVPEPRIGPPIAPAYQFMVAVPELAVALKVTVPGPQRSPGVVLFIVGVVVTVATTAVRSAEVQPFSVVST